MDVGFGIPRTEDHAGAKHDGLESLAARLADDVLGLSLRTGIRRIDAFEVPGRRLVGRISAGPRSHRVERRGIDEPTDARTTSVFEKLAGRDHIDLMAEPATVAPQTDPAGGVNHAAIPSTARLRTVGITDVADDPIDGRIVPRCPPAAASGQTTDRVAGIGHVPRDVSADEAASPRDQDGPSGRLGIGPGLRFVVQWGVVRGMVGSGCQR